VPFSTSVTNRSCGKALAPRLAPGTGAYKGDAQFTVSVNGQQVGGTLTTTANVP
jgi:hypothetical protein